MARMRIEDCTMKVGDEVIRIPNRFSGVMARVCGKPFVRVVRQVFVPVELFDGHGTVYNSYAEYLAPFSKKGGG